jgi:hypothetical protein
MVWRWTTRQETMRESWKLHSITVGAPGGGVFLPSHNKILDKLVGLFSAE